MSAYIIADVEVTDAKAYEEYRARVPAIIAAHGGRYIARGGQVQALEGGWEPSRCVIIEFPDMERALGFWNAQDYAPLRRIRETSARSRIIVTDGYKP